MSLDRAESVISCAKDQAVWPWQAEPYKLWSLLAMLQFFAADFCQSVGIFPQVWVLLNSGRQPDPESMRACFGAVQHLLAECERLPLPVSLRLCHAIRDRITSGEMTGNHELSRMITDLYGRILDELAGPHFLMLTVDEAVAYQTPLRDWAVPLKAFPSIQVDVEEAQKCYALERSTACVFHLMRALGSPLAALSLALGIEKHSPTWNAYLSAMHAAIQNKFPEKTKKHGEKREYYSALEAQLRAIKDAWRNSTIHEIAKVYTDEMAHEIIILVRGFMREAAKELHE